MPAKPSSPETPLPRSWPSRSKSAILYVISLGQFSLACATNTKTRARSARRALTRRAVSSLIRRVVGQTAGSARKTAATAAGVCSLARE